jgi:two-component system sensor histidine kinase TctE
VESGACRTATAYAALVDFYNDQVDRRAGRVAVLLQPVASANGRGMAVIQVAETLELREALTRRILFNRHLWRQAVLVAVIVVVAVVVVQRATRPVRQLSAELQARPEGDLSRFDGRRCSARADCRWWTPPTR